MGVPSTQYIGLIRDACVFRTAIAALDIDVSHSIISLLIGHFLLELGTLKMQREECDAEVPHSDPIGGTLTPGDS